MLQYLSVVGIAAIVATVLMVVAMLYLVLDVVGNDVHTPSPDDDDRPELEENEESAETQGELAADGNST